MPAFPVVIIGAGFLGRQVARALRGPVIATTRDGVWNDGEPPDHVRLERLDVAHASASELDEVLTRAGSMVICYASAGEQDRRTLYLDGGGRLAAAAGRRKLQRLVYVSSTSALPDAHGPVDETTPGSPSSERGQIQRAAEELFSRACVASQTPWTVLRLAGLYGPDREIGRIYRLRREGPLPGDGMTATNLIHRDDAVSAVVAALDLPPETSTVIHVCDDDHAPRRSMYAAAARARGEPEPVWESTPSPHDAVRGKQVSNLRMKELLGVQLRFPRHSDRPL